MKLLIVESPKKCESIAKYLGEGWMVAASYGHIRDLPANDLGVAIPGFGLSYEVTEKGRKAVARLRELVGQCDETFLATDPDREGESIAWHLAEVLRLKNPKRATFTEITKDAIRSAVAAPRAIDQALVRAQEGRRVLDRLVGYNVSPVLSRGVKARASSGRVQSPATRLVVDREIEIETFKETLHFGARLTFAGGWSADWQTKTWCQPGSEYVLDRELASMAASARELQVKECTVKTVQRQPPAPFNMSTLLQAASAELSLSLERTTALAQGLYEKGRISYHRTDSVNLSDEAIAALQAEASRRGLAVAAPARKWKSKESAQEAHEAIRPADFAVDTAEEGDEQRLYDLIWRRAMCSQLATAEYEETVAVLEASVDRSVFTYRAVGRTLKRPGWLSLAKGQAEEDGQDGEGAKTNRVPRLQAGATIAAEAGVVLDKRTEPPRRFTEATLVKKLEELGIGRPSTYATIITTIVKRQYVRLEGKNLVPLGLGRQVVEFLKGKFGFVELTFTRDVEERLDQIAEGQAQYGAVVGEFYTRLVQEITATGIDPETVMAPSEKAAAFAQGIAEQLGVALPEEAIRTRSALSKWIDEHMGRVPATPPQIAAIQRAIDKGAVEPPDGWPTVTKAVATKLLDKLYGGSKKPKVQTRSHPTVVRKGSPRSKGKRA